MHRNASYFFLHCLNSFSVTGQRTVLVNLSNPYVFLITKLLSVRRILSFLIDFGSLIVVFGGTKTFDGCGLLSCVNN